MRFLLRTALGSAIRRAARSVLCCVAGIALATAAPAAGSAQGAAPRPPAAQDEGALQSCAPMVSLEGRLVMEQWARGEDCQTPLRTRTTDRYLGITCLEPSPDVTSCRAYVPPPGSRIFDTSRVFRCVDIALADTEIGTVVGRMVEWAQPSKACDWTKARDTLTMEVDFVRAEVCTGGLCAPVDKLSAIGKVRLRGLIESALRELGLTTSSASSRSPARGVGN